MLKTNEQKLVSMAAQGKVAEPPEFLPLEISHEGKPYALPSVGSITYNITVGDPAFFWKSDHSEPGVSTICTATEDRKIKGYNFLPCIGNEVVVVSGDAKGKKGVVTGKHGGVDHILIYFDDETLEKLNFEDKFLIRAFGQGLELLDFPEIHCYNLSPALLRKMNIKESGERAKGVLSIGVTHIVPAGIMGSGLGSISCARGDYDITTQDPETIKKYKLSTLRLGDLVAIEDADNRYGRSYKKGAVTIAVVAHCNSILAGHGPGVTTLLTCSSPKIKPFIDTHANIAELLKIGRYRK